MKISSFCHALLLISATTIGLTGCCHLSQPEVPVERYAEQNKELNVIYHFAFDKADLSPQDMPALDEFATYLLANPDAIAHVDGYTDAQGPRQYNMALGLRRAQAVANYLQEKGIPSEKIAVNSYGSDKLVDQAYTREAHAKNRRAVIYITQEEGFA